MALRSVVGVLALASSSLACRCPDDFPACYSDGDCVLAECATGCDWEEHVNYVKGCGDVGSGCSEDADGEAASEGHESQEGEPFNPAIILGPLVVFSIIGVVIHKHRQKRRAASPPPPQARPQAIQPAQHSGTQHAAESAIAPGLVYFVNRWKVQNGESRAGRMLGFGGDNATLEATWGQPGGDKVPWELLPADEWNPNTGQRVVRGTWNPLRGSQGSVGEFEHGGGKLFYIVNRWKTADGERRAGRMLGFSDHNAVLEATWGQPGGDKVPWELFPADQWNPNTGAYVVVGSWNALKDANGSGGAPPPTCGGQRFYIVNRWRAHDGERRTGRMLGFNGHNAILEATWARSGGGKVPWEALAARSFNPNTGYACPSESWSPMAGPQGQPGSSIEVVVHPQGQPESSSKVDVKRLSEIGLLVMLEQVGVGDDEQVLERAAAWVEAQKPATVGDIIQFQLVDSLVNALDLPAIPKAKLLGALQPMAIAVPAAQPQMVMGFALPSNMA